MTFSTGKQTQEQSRFFVKIFTIDKKEFTFLQYCSLVWLGSVACLNGAADAIASQNVHENLFKDAACAAFLRAGKAFVNVNFGLKNAASH